MVTTFNYHNSDTLKVDYLLNIYMVTLTINLNFHYYKLQKIQLI
jgi:hypothetical protein